MAEGLDILVSADATAALAVFNNLETAVQSFTDRIGATIVDMKQFDDAIAFAKEQGDLFWGTFSYEAFMKSAFGIMKTAGTRTLLELAEAYTTVIPLVTALNNQFQAGAKALTEYGGIAIPTIDNVKKTAFDLYRAFDDARGKVRTLTEDIGPLTASMQGIVKETKNQFTSTELLNESYNSLSAGFTTTQQNADVMKASVILSKAGFTNLATGVDAVTTTLNAYGMESSRAMEVADKLIQTQNLGKLTVETYGREIGKVATIAAQSGVSFEELNAMIAVATNKGVGAAEAVTGLRQAISAMLNPSSEAVDMAKKLGIQFDAAAIKSKGLSGVLAEIAAKGQDTPQVLNKLFGSVEALSVILPNTANQMQNFNIQVSGIKDSSGAAVKAFDAATGTINSSMTGLQNRINETLLGIGGAVAWWMGDLAKKATMVVDIFGSLNFSQQLGALAGFQATVDGIINAIKSLISTVTYLTATFIAWQVGTAISNAYNASIGVLSMTLDVAAGRTKLFTVVQWAMNAAATVSATITGILSGTITSLSFSFDLAATKGWLFAAAQTGMGVALGFANELIKVQAYLFLNIPYWFAEGAKEVVIFTNSLVGMVANMPVLTGSTGILTAAVNGLKAAWAYLATNIMPIVRAAFLSFWAQLGPLSVALASLAAKLLVFYLAWETVVSVAKMASLTLGQAGLSMSENAKQVDAAVAATGKSVDDGRVKIKAFGMTFADVTDPVTAFNTVMGALGAGLDRAKNPIEAIATVISNAINVMNGAEDASSRFGSQTGLLTLAQMEAANEQNKWGDSVIRIHRGLDDGTAVLAKYGLATKGIGAVSKLTAAQMATLREEAVTQVKSLTKQIEELKKIKTSDPEMMAQYKQTITLLENQKAAFQGVMVNIEKAAKGQATSNKIVVESFKDISTEYEQTNKKIEQSSLQRITAIEQAEAAGSITAREAQKQTLAVERDILEQRVKQAENILPRLRASLVGADPKDVKEINDKILAVEADALKAKQGIAKQELDIRRKALEERLKAEQDAIDKINRVQKAAVDAVTEAEQKRLINVQTLLNQGVLTKRQAEDQQLAITQQRLKAEFDATAKQYADLEKLPKPINADPKDPTKAGDYEKKVAERDGLLSSLRQKQNALALSLLKTEEEAQKRVAAVAIQQMEIQVSSQQNLSKLQEARININKANLDLAKADLDLAESRASRELANISKAKDLRGQLASLTDADGEKRAAIEARLSQLGFDRNTSELGFATKKAQVEDNLAAVRQKALEARLAGERLSLQLDIQKEGIQQRIAVLQAEIAIKKAVADKADTQTIQMLKEVLKATKDQGEAVADINDRRWETLATQQQQTMEEAKANEEARKFDQKLELIDAKTGKVASGLRAATNTAGGLASMGDRVASGFGRAADTIDGFARGLDEATKKAIKLAEEAQKVGALNADQISIDLATKGFSEQSLGSRKLTNAELFAAGQDPSLSPEARKQAQVNANETKLKDREAFEVAQKKLEELNKQNTSNMRGLELDKHRLEIQKASIELDKARQQVSEDTTMPVHTTASNYRLALMGAMGGTPKMTAPIRSDPQTMEQLIYGYADLFHNSFAGGVENFQGGLAYVHQGELLVNLPKGTDVIPANKVPSFSSTSDSQSQTIRVENINIVDRAKPQEDMEQALIKLGRMRG